MKKVLLFFLFGLCIVGAIFFISNKRNFSNDCQTWTFNPTDSFPAGFYRHGAEVTYFDPQRKIWIELQKKPVAFMLRGQEFYFLKPNSFRVFPYTSAIPSRDIQLYTFPLDFLKSTFGKEGWHFTFDSGPQNVFLEGRFAHDQRCKKFPKATHIWCPHGEACDLWPEDTNDEKEALLCAQEVGLLDSHEVGILDRTCAVLDDGKVYDDIFETYAWAKQKCEIQTQHLAFIDTMRAACKQARAQLPARSFDNP